jgi:cytochrome P450
VTFDALSDAFMLDPGAAFAAEPRVFHYEPIDAWVLTRHADIDAALPNFRDLSQKTFQNVPVPPAFKHRIPDGFFSHSWIALDPPAHTHPRKVAQRGFTRPRIASLEPTIEALADELIDGFADAGSVELMDTYCIALTTRTLLGLFGLSREYEPLVRQLSHDHVKVFNEVLDPLPEPERTEVWTRYADAWDTIRPIVDERASDPGDDVISVMAAELERDRVVLHVCEMAFAGTDTTANLMANAVIFLDQHPEQRAAVRANAELWPAVVEETLRRRASVAAVPRIATRELTVGDTTIPAGARVWIGLQGANTDGDHYACPMDFDIARERPGDHLGFGKGRHFCMGAPLARAQARIGLQRIYDRLGDLDVEPGHELDFIRVPGAPSRRSLPVSW